MKFVHNGGFLENSWISYFICSAVLSNLINQSEKKVLTDKVGTSLIPVRRLVEERHFQGKNLFVFRLMVEGCQKKVHELERVNTEELRKSTPNLLGALVSCGTPAVKSMLKYAAWLYPTVENRSEHRLIIIASQLDNHSINCSFDTEA
jgi:hypothetical protein